MPLRRAEFLRRAESVTGGSGRGEEGYAEGTLDANLTYPASAPAISSLSMFLGYWFLVRFYPPWNSKQGKGGKVEEKLVEEKLLISPWVFAFTDWGNGGRDNKGGEKFKGGGGVLWFNFQEGKNTGKVIYFSLGFTFMNQRMAEEEMNAGKKKLPISPLT